MNRRPSHVPPSGQSVKPSYRWTKKLVEKIYDDEYNDVLEERLLDLSDRANLALAVASAEWIVHRYDGLSDDPAPDDYLQALWAVGVDSCYMSGAWGERKGWTGPVRGPLSMAVELAQDALMSLYEGPGPGRAMLSLSSLARVVLPDVAAFEVWRDQAIDRLAALFPANAMDPLGDVVPPAALNLALPFDLDDLQPTVQRFLASLDPGRNIYLSSPERMLESKFDGTPYVFDLAQDRASRDGWRSGEGGAPQADGPVLATTPAEPSCPAYVKLADQAPPFTWDGDTMWDSGGTDLRMEDQIGYFWPRITLALAAGMAKWIIYRPPVEKTFIDIVTAVEASIMDRRYLNLVSTDTLTHWKLSPNAKNYDDLWDYDNDLMDPHVGPKWVAIDHLLDVVDMTRPDAINVMNVVSLARLAKQVLSKAEMKAFNAWRRAMMARLEGDLPAREFSYDAGEEGEDLGPFLAPDFLDPGVPFAPERSNELAHAFLQRLRPEENEFLTPADMLRKLGLEHPYSLKALPRNQTPPSNVPATAVIDEDGWALGEKNAAGQKIDLWRYWRDDDGSLECEEQWGDGLQTLTYQRFHRNGSLAQSGQKDLVRDAWVGTMRWTRLNEPSVEDFYYPGGKVGACWVPE